MRRSKSDTIAEYREAFLAGKSEDYRKKFDEKNENQQYAAISHWKSSAKNFAGATKDLAKVTATTVVSYLKDAHKKLKDLETLSPKESAKIISVLDSVKDTIDNFSRLKKEQLLDTLKSEKEKLQKQGMDLDRQIEALQNELN